MICDDGDPEHHFLALRALRARVMVSLDNKQEAQRIISFIEEEINNLPWPRKLETMLSIAHARKELNQNKSAQALARFVNKHAVLRGLWRTSIESLLLLITISPNDAAAKAQFLTQLEAIKKNIPKQYLDAYLAQKIGS